jgi:ubiquinone/menaquinone biosynthesis C-methylase UbiE
VPLPSIPPPPVTHVHAIVPTTLQQAANQPIDDRFTGSARPPSPAVVVGLPNQPNAARPIAALQAAGQRPAQSRPIHPGPDLSPPRPPADFYGLARGAAGSPRLALSEKAYGPDHRALISNLRTTPGLWPGSPVHLLVLGGGSGAQLPALLDMVGPQGTICFTDNDASQLNEARQIAQAQGWDKQVQFAPLDASREVAKATYDMVYSRFLLVHLKDPAGALANMWKALRPGGLLISEEHDVSTLRSAPPSAGADGFRQLLKALSKKQGLHWDEGEAMPSFFQQAGIPVRGSRRRFPSFQVGAEKQLAVMSLREGRRRYEEANLIQPAEMQKLIDDLQNVTDDPGSKLYMGTLAQTWAQKPEA